MRARSIAAIRGTELVGIGTIARYTKACLKMGSLVDSDGWFTQLHNIMKVFS